MTIGAFSEVNVKDNLSETADVAAIRRRDDEIQRQVVTIGQLESQIAQLKAENAAYKALAANVRTTIASQQLAALLANPSLSEEKVKVKIGSSIKIADLLLEELRSR